ncbi:MAG: transporter [Syntrophales bacterium]|nr:transporter [Syntrophales bacterium]
MALGLALFCASLHFPLLFPNREASSCQLSKREDAVKNAGWKAAVNKAERAFHRKKRCSTVSRKVLAALVGLALFLCAGYASADNIQLPPVNLGVSSFQDGIAFPGWLVEESIGYYHAGQFNSHQGDKIPGSNEITTVSATTQIAYLSKVRMFGGFVGAQLILPLVDIDMNTSFGPKDRERGVGDLIVCPFILQWTDHKLFGLPYFHRFLFGITLPTGDYDRNRAVNAGSHIFSINPYYAFTIILTDKLELSGRLHYRWNSKNDEPFVGIGAGDIQPGQAFHFNYAASYEVVKGVRLGINGYFLQQLTEDKVDGHSQSNSKERVFSIGPGIQFRGNGVSLYINGYFETGAENRPEGTRVNFRISKVF